MARNDKDFLGLEVISLEDASVVGEIDGLIIDETKGVVAGLVVDMGLYEAKMVAYADIRGVGEDALTVDSASSLRLVSQYPELEEIARRDIQITDMSVLTDSGDYVGSAGDFFIDATSGKIKGIEVLIEHDEDEESRVVPIAQVVRVGPDLILLRSGFERRTLASGETL